MLRMQRRSLGQREVRVKGLLKAMMMSPHLRSGRKDRPSVRRQCNAHEYMAMTKRAATIAAMVALVVIAIPLARACAQALTSTSLFEGTTAMPLANGARQSF